MGPFGVGRRHRSEPFARAASADTALLITPENLRPRFARQSDGSFANTDLPTYRGARPTKNADITWTLHFKDGTTWSFNGSGWVIGQTDRTGNALRIHRDSQNR